MKKILKQPQFFFKEDKSFEKKSFLIFFNIEIEKKDYFFIKIDDNITLKIAKVNLISKEIPYYIVSAIYIKDLKYIYSFNLNKKVILFNNLFLALEFFANFTIDIYTKELTSLNSFNSIKDIIMKKINLNKKLDIISLGYYKIPEEIYKIYKNKLLNMNILNKINIINDNNILNDNLLKNIKKEEKNIKTFFNFFFN